MSRITIFEGRDETLCLRLPLVILAAALVGAVWHFTPAMPHFNEWILFIIASVLLDVTHNIFTFFILLTFPEARDWIFGSLPRGQLVLKWGLYFLALVWFFKFGSHWVSTRFKNSHLILAAVLGFVAVCYHVVRQIEGLSLLYNRELERRCLSKDLLGQLRRSERRERVLFHWIILLFGVQVVARVYSPLYDLHTLQIVVALLLLVVVLGVIGNSHTYPMARHSNKATYLLRLLLFPLGAISFLAAIGPPMYHGVEYLFVCRKMYRRSKLRSTASRRTVLVLATLVILVLLLLVTNSTRGIRWVLEAQFPAQRGLLEWMSAFSLAITFMHFYLDGRIFRMKDPWTRECLGPLLISHPTAQPAPGLQPKIFTQEGFLQPDNQVIFTP